MKAIMISGKPKWTALMMNGDKTDEIRKNKGLYKAIQKLIDEYGYADIYWYCSKDKKNLLHKNCADIYWVEDDDFRNMNKQLGLQTEPILNGKVLFKFRCYKVEEYINGCKLDGDYGDYEYILKPSCLTEDELYDYCEDLSFYSIHISDLEIFDRPRELNEFIQTKRKSWEEPNVIKAPQNFCYIEM